MYCVLSDTCFERLKVPNLLSSGKDIAEGKGAWEISSGYWYTTHTVVVNLTKTDK